MDWNSKRVLVCGGAGFIGSHLARELLHRGAEVTVADNMSSGSPQNVKDIKDDVIVSKSDLRYKEVCQRLAVNKDCIFQFAANMGGIGYITSIGADIMHDSALINVNMLDVVRRCETPIYFYSSSACIYPEYRQKEAEVTPLKESDAYPAEPDQFYGWEKLFTEKLCEAYQKDYGINIRIARFHNIYGEAFTAFDEAKAKAPCKMLLRAMQYPEKKIEIWNDGKQTRSFCYIIDCIEGILKLMDSDYQEPVNIGSDYLISMNDLAELVKEISGKDMDFVRYLDKAQGVRGRNANLDLVKRELGWSPVVSLKEGMTRVYQWGLEHFNELEGI